MRSAERLPLALAALAAGALLAGCGAIGLRMPGSSATAAAAAPASAPAASGAAVAAGVPRPASTGPIAPATQRAYDDALALMRAGRAADAERGLRALVQTDPELAGPHANLGLLARQAGRLPEAVKELETATELAPGMAVAWNQLGLAYRQAGQFAKAQEAYAHAIALDPNYANAVLNLGVLEDLYLADNAQALALYTRYLALTPAGDPVVAKWVADVRNRLPKSTAPAASASASAPASAGASKEKS